MGKYSVKKVWEVIDNCNFITDNQKYLFVKLDKSAYSELLQALSEIKNEYVEVINDPEEVSLIVTETTWTQRLQTKFKTLDQYTPLAIITCKVTIEQVTGFLPWTISILSMNNVGVFVQGAYTTDHIFVEYDNLDKALGLLNQLKGK